MLQALLTHNNTSKEISIEANTIIRGAFGFELPKDTLWCTQTDLSGEIRATEARMLFSPVSVPFIEISSRVELERIGNDPAYSLAGNYLLMNDIDLSDAPWEPIGSYNAPFGGIFNGGGYTISGLILHTYDRDKYAFGSCFGLFAKLNRCRPAIDCYDDYYAVAVQEDPGMGQGPLAVRDLNIIIKDVQVAEDSRNVFIGGLAGYIELAKVANIHVSGADIIDKRKSRRSLTGIRSAIGGIAGKFTIGANMVVCSSSISIISPNGDAGGLAGTTEQHSIIISSHASGDISAGYHAGGISGFLNYNAVIFNCHASGSVMSDEYAGGIAGALYSKSSIEKSAYYGSSVHSRGGYDYLASIAVVIEKTSKLIDNISSFKLKTPIKPKIKTPLIKISNEKELRMIGDKYPLDGRYKLVADITLPEDTQWEPIGSYDKPFTGSFDGGGHYIKGLKPASAKFSGLFGYIKKATVKNLHIQLGSKAEIPEFEGYNYYIGGAVGCADNSQIRRISVTGRSIKSASFGTVGGIVGVGRNKSKISECFSTVNIIGEGNSGGIAGIMLSSSAIRDCYSTGDIEQEWDFCRNYLGGTLIENSAVYGCYFAGWNREIFYAYEDDDDWDIDDMPDLDEFMKQRKNRLTLPVYSFEVKRIKGRLKRPGEATIKSHSLDIIFYKGSIQGEYLKTFTVYVENTKFKLNGMDKKWKKEKGYPNPVLAWQPTGLVRKATLRFCMNGGTFAGKPDDFIAEVLASTLDSIRIPIPMREDRIFDGWIAEDGSIFDDDTLIMGDMVLTARWDPAA